MASPRTQQALERLAGLTPKQIVEELDRYIVGQGACLAMLVAPLIFKRLSDSFIDGRWGLAAFAGLAGALAALTHRMSG